MAVFSTIQDNQPLDITGRLLVPTVDEFDPSVSRNIQLYNFPHEENYLSVIDDSKIQLNKNNTTGSNVEKVLPIELSKNGVIVMTHVTVTIVDQNAIIPDPSITVRNAYDDEVSVSRPKAILDIEVSSDYQFDDIKVTQGGKPLTVNFDGNRGSGVEKYTAYLDEVKGENQTATITVRLGDQVVNKKITLIDRLSPRVETVTRDLRITSLLLHLVNQ